MCQRGIGSPREFSKLHNSRPVQWLTPFSTLLNRTRQWKTTASPFRYGPEPYAEGLDEIVENHRVDGFHRAHVKRGHVEAVVAHLLELSAVVTGDAHCRKPVCIGPLDCL